ncbi:hypothetical protein V2A60_009196 [Cordyceps javanica]
MGCGASKPANPATALAKRLDEQGPLSELEWYCRPVWGQYIEYIYGQAKENGSIGKLRQNFGEVLNSTAKDFLEMEYPECAKAGTTEDLRDGTGPFGSNSSPCVATKAFVTLDEGFNGSAYAYTLVIDSPMAWKSVSDGAGGALPKRIVDAPQTKLAQRSLTSILDSMDKGGSNVRHCVINLIIGSVMLSARWKPHNLIPSLALISQNADTELPGPKTSSDDDHGATPPLGPQRMFRSHMFMSVLKTLETEYPGCTIWDAGEMPFRVEDEPYPHSARFLVCREFDQRNKDVKTFDFKVEGPDTHGNNTVATLVRARDPSEDPGGIVCLAIVVNVDPEDQWPKRDMEKNLPIMASALEQSTKHGMIMSFLKGFDRCALRVWVGQDTRHYTLITPHTKGETAQHVQQFSDLLFGGPVDPLKPSANLEDASDLEETFGVKLTRKEEHRLWESESHFQKMRHAMQERAKADPGRYEQIGIIAGHQSAAKFMENNFGDRTISDEGELPQPDQDGILKFGNTKMLVARDLSQGQSSIVAVLVAIPCPVPGYSAMVDREKLWVDTPEMKRAEDTLLAVLEKWYGEGKVSTKDCFVQVMMGMDAATYQFVDGEKFIDYPEERMKQIRWQ